MVDRAVRGTIELPTVQWDGKKVQERAVQLCDISTSLLLLAPGIPLDLQLVYLPGYRSLAWSQQGS